MKCLSLLIKPVSGNCNLRCRYCFYTDVVSLRKEKGAGMMSLETLERLVYKALSESTQMCVFGFQGGEPTLAGIDFYRELIRFEKQYNTNRVSIRHSLQTNGLLLDSEWCAFLAENKFLTGLSMDGPKFLHDVLRVDGDESGTHSRCLQAARLLTKHKAEFNILTVVTRHLAAHPGKVYQYYKRQGFRHLQFIPCLERLEETDDSHTYSPDNKRCGYFLHRLFDLWYEDFEKGDYYSIRNFDNFIYILAGYPPENCAASGLCSVSPLVEADGSVYPCDFYALDPYRMGSVYTHSFADMLSGDIAMSFIAPSRAIHPACKTCSYYPVCRNGCRRERIHDADGQLGQNRYCAAYRQFFQYTMPRMAHVARGLR
ncbi:MAG: anaerobic sulfatase maturase [Oscillospiraceae bacterium]|jgi:uncharacterized protein|nr:anaerobic sulfatase maturase [Oscillospiraceae bacterium]